MTIKLLLISLLLSNVALFADFEDGKELFNDAKCMECHNDEDFTPKKKLSNFKKLHQSVDACRFDNDADWFDDESMDVTKYLNHKYYHFKAKKD